MENLESLCISLAASHPRSHPERHLQLDGGTGTRVPEREAPSQRHVLLGQQDVQRHRQVSQRALVLVVFHLKEKQGVGFTPVGGAAKEKREALIWRGAFLSVMCAAVPPAPAPASWGCAPGRINNLPTEAPWFCSGSLTSRQASVGHFHQPEGRAEGATAAAQAWQKSLHAAEFPTISAFVLYFAGQTFSRGGDGGEGRGLLYACVKLISV